MAKKKDPVFPQKPCELPLWESEGVWACPLFMALSVLLRFCFGGAEALALACSLFPFQDPWFGALALETPQGTAYLLQDYSLLWNFFCQTSGQFIFFPYLSHSLTKREASFLSLILHQI